MDCIHGKTIDWVCKKEIDLNSINEKINVCINSKHFTNNSRYVRELEISLKNIFAIDDHKEVIMVNNGANGINAIVGGVNIHHNVHYKNRLKWITQAFTFPCSKQGHLIDSDIVDLGEFMGPSLDELEKKINDFDCLFITNCFGCCVSIDDYIIFCNKYNKLLFFDNAASPLTYYKGKNHLNYGNGCVISLHHTKPVGFGEGGFIVCDKSFSESFRRAICFGYTNVDRNNYSEYAGNYKMSEISCIYAMEYLKNVPKIFEHHTRMFVYFMSELDKLDKSNKLKLYKNYAEYKDSLMSTIPLIFNEPIDGIVDIFIGYNIEAKKYYYPLDIKCTNSTDIYNKIICLPLNMDINYDVIDLYIQIISKLIG